MDAKSAKKGSLADAPSADADIARAEHSLSQQSTSKGLSSALPEDVSPADRETPDKREASGILPKLNADRQSVQPVMRPPVMGGHLGSWMATRDASLTGPRITFSIEI